MSILIMWIILVEGTTNQCLKWSMIIYEKFLWIMFCFHFISQSKGLGFFCYGHVYVKALLTSYNLILCLKPIKEETGERTPNI